MKIINTMLPLLALPALTAAAQQRQAADRPNVIFIYADDIGYGDLSCNGSTTIRTPNVERLAQEGVRFTNCHSAAATSTPSRYAMLTGEYAWRRAGTGIADGDAAMIIRPERYTMADMFHDRGYATCAIGKWHLGLGDESGKQNWNGSVGSCPRDIGFDYSFIMAATGDRVPCVFIENDRVHNLSPHSPIYVNYRKNFPGEPTGRDNPELLVMHPSHGHDQSIVNGISRIGYMKGGKGALWDDSKIAETLTERAVDFINKNARRPFFLYFATQDAHVPRVPGERFRGKSGHGVRGDVMLEFDWSVGEILAAVKAAGIEKNTVIILSSDNGPVVDDGYADGAVEALGDHRPWGEYRGGKYSAYEAGTRVPCILRWAGKVESKVSNELMTQLDWMASLGALIGAKLPAGAAPDSDNYLQAWLGGDKGRDYFVGQNAQNTLSILTREWKYIEPSDRPGYNKNVNIELGNNREPQLYDMTHDPAESRNVAKLYPEIAAQLAAKLNEVKDNRVNQPLISNP